MLFSLYNYGRCFYWPWYRYKCPWRNEFNQSLHFGYGRREYADQHWRRSDLRRPHWQGDVEDANKIFRHGMLLAACVSAVFSFVGVFFTDEVCIMLGAGILFTVMRQIICSAIPFVLFPLIYIRHYNSIAVMTAHLDW